MLFKVFFTTISITYTILMQNVIRFKATELEIIEIVAVDASAIFRNSGNSYFQHSMLENQKFKNFPFSFIRRMKITQPK